MKVLLDTDVLIDIALNRDPFVVHSAKLLDAVQECTLHGFIAWHSISNIYYICSGDFRKVKNFISDLTEILQIPETGSSAFKIALDLPMKDLEDAMQVAAAINCKADMIATRNIKHYRKSPIPAFSPKEIVEKFL